MSKQVSERKAQVFAATCCRSLCGSGTGERALELRWRRRVVERVEAAGARVAVGIEEAGDERAVVLQGRLPEHGNVALRQVEVLAYLAPPLSEQRLPAGRHLKDPYDDSAPIVVEQEGRVVVERPVAAAAGSEQPRDVASQHLQKYGQRRRREHRTP